MRVMRLSRDSSHASLSAKGFELTRNIMRLNETLAEMANDHEFLGEWLYFIFQHLQPHHGRSQ